MFFRLIRSIGLLLSFYGYISFFAMKIDRNLAIGFTFASIGSAMFLAGLLNILPEMAITIFCLGLILFLTEIRNKKISLCIGGVYVALAAIVVLACVYGKMFLTYDNFSHWATAVKHMYLTNRFPNFMDPYIDFQSYPLGAGVFNYYCLKITNIRSEWFQMLVHAVCNLGMLSGLFCLSRDRLSELFCAICCTLLLSAVNAADMLCVDGMLAFTAICAFAFCIYYRDCLHEKGWYLSPWLAFLVSIKNSGLLFAFLIILWVLVFAEIKHGKLRLTIGLSFVTLVTAWLWRKHVKFVFVNGNAARHSISLSQFKNIFDSKSIDDVHNITTGVIRNIFSVTNPYFLVFVFSAVVFIMSLIYAKQNKAVRNMLLYSFICYVIYQLGLLGMFLFSMPRPEAITLLGWSRYHSTSWIFSTGVLAASLMQLDSKLQMKTASIGYLLCVACFILSGGPSLRYFQTSSPEKYAVRQKCETIIKDNDIPVGKRYLIIVDSDHNDSGYLYYLIKYLLFPEYSQVIKVDNISDQIINDDEYDYLIAYGSTKEVNVLYEEYSRKTNKIVR